MTYDRDIWHAGSPNAVNNVGRLKTKGYQLSLIDPRDKIVQQTELDDLCDKLQWSSVGARRFYQLS